MLDLTDYSVYKGKVYADEKLHRGFNNIDRNQIQVIKKATENFLKEIVATTGESNYTCTKEDVVKIIHLVNSILRNNGYYVYIPNELKEKVKTENNPNDPIIPDNKYYCSYVKNASISSGDNKLYYNPDNYSSIVKNSVGSNFRLDVNEPKAQMMISK